MLTTWKIYLGWTPQPDFTVGCFTILMVSTIFLFVFPRLVVHSQLANQKVLALWPYFLSQGIIACVWSILSWIVPHRIGQFVMPTFAGCDNNFVNNSLINYIIKHS